MLHLKRTATWLPLMAALALTGACVDGEFFRECTSGDQCPSGQICRFSNCVDPNPGDGQTNNGQTNNGASNNASSSNNGTPGDNGSNNASTGNNANNTPTNNASTCTPTDEVCDGEDNDCDGDIDDGVLNACGDCGEPPQEVCDSLDNDCDGDTDADDDDMAPTSLCPLQEGECDGSRAFCEGGLETTCGPAEYAAASQVYEPVESLCDGRDNDCDGDEDELCCNAVASTRRLAEEGAGGATIDLTRGGGVYGWVGSGSATMLAGVVDASGAAVGNQLVLSPSSEETSAWVLFNGIGFEAIWLEEGGDAIRIQPFSTSGVPTSAQSARVPLELGGARYIGRPLVHEDDVVVPLTYADSPAALAFLDADRDLYLTRTRQPEGGEGSSFLFGALVMGDLLVFRGAREPAEGEVADMITVLQKNGAAVTERAHREWTQDAFEYGVSTQALAPAEGGGIARYGIKAGVEANESDLTREGLDLDLETAEPVDVIGTYRDAVHLDEHATGAEDGEKVLVTRVVDGTVRPSVLRRPADDSSSIDLFYAGVDAILFPPRSSPHPNGVATIGLARPTAQGSDGIFWQVQNIEGDYICPEP